VDNVEMDLAEIEWDGMDWICLDQDRDKFRALVNVVIDLRVPLIAGKLPNGCTTFGLSSNGQLRGVGYHAKQEYRSGKRIHGNIAVT
jgi:hypothetical protein